MKLFKCYLTLMALALLIFSSCNEDTDAIDTPDNNSDYVIADDLVINGTLVNREFDPISEAWVLNTWDKGTGKISVALSTSDEVGSGNVSVDGSFTLTINGKMLKTNLIDFLDMAGGLTWNPNSFKCTIIPAVVSFYPTGSDVPKLINYGLLKQDNSEIQTSFGFIYSDQTASISGTSTIGDEYDLQYKKGWNIWSWYEDVNNKTHYSTVNSLPANIVWY